MSVATAKVARRRVADAVFKVFCVLVTAAALVALAAILWTLISKGIGGIKPDLFTMSTPAPGSTFTIPTLADAKTRLELLDIRGPSATGFTFQKAFDPNGMPMELPRLFRHEDAAQR